MIEGGPSWSTVHYTVPSLRQNLATALSMKISCPPNETDIKVKTVLKYVAKQVTERCKNTTTERSQRAESQKQMKHQSSLSEHKPGVNVLELLATMLEALCANIGSIESINSGTLIDEDYF